MCFVASRPQAVRGVVSAELKLHPWLAVPIPYWTLLVNVCGALLFGLVAGATSQSHVLAAFNTGFCGGLTTFSTCVCWRGCPGHARRFAYDTYTLLGRGVQWALLNVLLNVLLCVLAAALGLRITK